MSGTVSDASGPLPGASILVKGTTNGAQTDIDGKFTIRNVGANAVLVLVTLIENKEINVAERNNFSYSKEDSAELKEVVVIGYGSVKERKPVDQLNSKNFDNVAAPNQLIY
jgi:iron complex outermembrane receptor protein